MITVWWKFGKPDLSLTMNGALAGLVAITAPVAYVSPGAALYIGAIGGIIVVYSVVLLDKIRVDDPVGAVPVHAINGIWGTLAVGFFGQKSLGLSMDGLFYGGGFKMVGIQLLGTLAVSVFIMVSMWLVFKTIDSIVGLRVSEDEELRGLDIGEHGMESYSGFEIFTTE
jgi:Amt family ammonium transporter